MKTQEEVYQEARTLAAQGEEYAHLIRGMGMHHVDMLKHFVCCLPEDIANKTIYGMLAVRSRAIIPKGRGRPRK